MATKVQKSGETTFSWEMFVSDKMIDYPDEEWSHDKIVFPWNNSCHIDQSEWGGMLKWFFFSVLKKLPVEILIDNSFLFNPINSNLNKAAFS